MPAAAISSFMQLLQQSGILDERQILEAERLQAECAGASENLAAKLVQSNLLTPFQAEILLSGEPMRFEIGPYLLIDRLGQGGMGQVFKAVHRRLGRLVALKVIKPECLAGNPAAVQRFQREARAAAMLSHPNIVMIYDANQTDDTHFLAMEYVAGPDLSRVVKDGGPLSLEDACACIRQAGLGLQHAFEQGMVHRDIKPSNLLVALPQSGRKSGPEITFEAMGEGSKLPRGAVIKILDMGLARIVDPGTENQTALTYEGHFYGTPDFISPEQARNAREADIRSDLYSLGCTLFHLLTGRPPFSGATALEKLLAHQLDTPPRLETLRSDITPEVGAIVSKLMAKKPEERYQEPAELVEALDRLELQRERSRGPSTMLPSTVPTVVMPTPPTVDTPPIETAAVLETPPPLPRPAPLTSDEAADITPRSSEGLSRRGIRSADTPAPVLPTGAPKPKKVAAYPAHSGWVMALDFRADRNQLVSGGMDGAVHLWGFSSSVPKHEILSLPRLAEVHAVAFSPNQHWLAVGAGTLAGSIWLWDRRGQSSASPQHALQAHQAPVEVLAFSPDSKWLASGSCDRTVRLWDVTASKPRESATLEGHKELVKTLAFSPDGSLLASGGHDGSIRIWRLGRRWTELCTLAGHPGHVLSLTFSPDGRTLASAGLDEKIKLWDLTGDTPGEQSVRRLEGHEAVVRCLRFTPDSQRLLSVGGGGRIFFWDPLNQVKLFEWSFPSSTLANTHSFTLDGRYLATGLSDGQVLIYRLPFREMSL